MTTGSAIAFSYRRAVAPMMWVIAGLMTIELVVTHLLLSFWFPRTMIVVSVLTLAGLVWLVMVIAGFGRLPVLLGPDVLVMRVGRLKRIDVPVATIAGVGGERSRDELKRIGASNFALVAHPNVVVTLREPVRWRGRMVRALAHRLDDPAAFMRAIAGVGAGR